MRVNLAGKTVMPALIDTHVHPSHTREALAVDLQRRAFYGVSAMMSLGQDDSGDLLSMRDQTVPGRARYFSSGRGITSPLPGRSHMRLLEDVKGLLRAGVDAFAHSIRDKDIDEEGLALFKQHPNVVVNPNLPDRGVKVDLSWLRASMSPAEMVELEKRNTD